MLLNESIFFSIHLIPHCVLATTPFSLSPPLEITGTQHTACSLFQIELNKAAIFMEAYHDEDRVKNTAVVEKKIHEEEEEEEEKLKSATSPASASPAYSPASSPSHEFSFTISLHSSDDKSRQPPASFAVDLSPADDIFFHGHLLPLHFLSHLPVSPRSSTNSLDSFTLPIRDLLDEQQRRPDGNCNAGLDKHHHHPQKLHEPFETRIRSKLKSFSFFGLKNWQRKAQKKTEETEDPRQKHRQKRNFGLSQVLKRYVKLVKPPLFFRSRRKNRENLDLRPQPYSFSGDLLVKNRHDLRGLRGEYSAPASMRTSPTNSGHLVATTTTTSFSSSSTSDSTMEELQAAIQAAIAHCKNSVGLEDQNIKC